MKQFSFLLLALISFSSIGQDVFIRYNQAGYSPKRPKSLVILSNIDLKDSAWSIAGNSKVINSLEIGKSFTGKGFHTPFRYNYKVDISFLDSIGNYNFSIAGKSVDIKIKEDPYSKYASSVLRYLRQQRSGSNQTLDHLPGHFTDSSCYLQTRINKENNNWTNQTSGKKANLLGGWYDAGDYLKFTLTTSYTTYLLLRAYENNPQLFQEKKYSKSKYNDLLDEAKWGLDYLLKAYVNDSTFVIQVGNQLDHEQGNRLPNLDKNGPNRHAYTALSRPHLGFTSAALSLASTIFKDQDPQLSELYLKKAESLFKLAEKNKESAWYSKGHETFYDDKLGFDNIYLANVELFKATNNPLYKSDISYYADGTGMGHWASWGDFHMHAHARAYQFYPRAIGYLKGDLNVFNGHSEHPNNIFGVPHEYTWATLFSMISVASGAIQVQQLKGIKDFEHIKWDVVDYVFGRNNWGVSFLAHKDFEKSIKNVYSQVYKLQPNLFPEGAIAEGPGDRKTHDELDQYFRISSKTNAAYAPFNSEGVVFFDSNSDFQSMETTIGGLADGLFLLSLLSK